MEPLSRRTFMLHVVAGASALATTLPATASDPIPTEKVTEADSYAKSMGFRLNTKNVDQAKFPRHTTEQSCASCQLYSGKPGDALGPCSFFKRLVPPDGWCRNFKVRKPA